MSGKAWEFGGKSPKEHKPRYKYDCDRCKFHWNCGLLCSCVLREMGDPPPRRKERVNLLRFKEWPLEEIASIMES